MARCFTILIAPILFAWALTGSLTAARPYTGPRPPSKDAVYLVHADRLLETEVHMAQERATRNEITYIIPGDRSLVRTPLASPVMVIETETMDAESLRLFRLDVKNGHREICFRYDGKSGAIPLRAEITAVSAGLYRIDVIDTLPPGEYAMSPDGANDVFCFEVF